MEVIYDKLLREAQQSPLILSDLAGLESYISESYTNRSFIELLQNADDAHSTNFLVKKYNDYLIIANNGRVFNELDIISLCRSASSSKVRGCSIGYRGIGFKSVVSIADEVHLISGKYEITFSRELTAKLIPTANRVPLIRIPHIIRKSVKNQLKDIISCLREEGYTTFFIFTGVSIEQVKEEYERFSHTSLLFLRNIQKIHVSFDDDLITQVNEVSKNDECRNVSITSNSKKTEWRIFSRDSCSLVFSIVEGKISKLKQEEARLHAFLPTDDITGLGVLINADFSTEPSRRHLIYDENTLDAINRITRLYAFLFERYIIDKNEESYLIIEALLPYYDIRLVHLTNNSFYKHFSSTMKKYLSSLSLYKLPPTWLNLSDFSKIYNNKINYDVFKLPNIESFFKHLGGKVADNEDILSKVEDSELSIVGCAEIVSDCIKKILLNIKVINFAESKLFSSNNRIYSLQYINDNNKNIDSFYLNLLHEKGISRRELEIYLKKYCFNNILDILNIENNQQNGFNLPKRNNQTQLSKPQAEPLNNIRPNLKIQAKWRSAEENALFILNSNGFNLKDVSNSNVGYDLEGLDCNGKEIFIEIKSIEYNGQTFRLTNNEFAVAQQKQDSYYILLVNQQHNYIELSWIRNPIKNLILDRKCIQWVWVCDEYEYEPLRINI